MERLLVPLVLGLLALTAPAAHAAVDIAVAVGRYPFTGGPTGVVPLSPGRSAISDTALPAGEYALVTWVRDPRTGKMCAARGMRALIAVEGD